MSKNRSTASARKINPFSRFAGDLPSLAPAGKSTKVDQVARRNLSLPAGHRALIAFSNVGRGPNHAAIYTWRPEDGTLNTNAPTEETVNFSMFPTSGGECVEMRASKSTLIVRNNTAPLNRAPYGYAFVGPNRPTVVDYPSEATNGNATLNSIFDQIYGRRETQAYEYSEARELINGMADFVDYHKYDNPSSFPLGSLERRYFHKESSTLSEDLGMTVTYFIIPTAATDQTLDLEFYNCIRARYDITSPLSRYGTVPPVAKGKTKDEVEKAAAEISEGKQPATHMRGGQSPR